MIENILKRHNARTGVKITVKSVIAAVLIALAVALPQIVHAAAGPAGGMQWLPMYLPVLLGGCLLGVRWGLGIGLLSPLVSFLITSAAGGAMPAAARLPYMMAELAVFAAVSGAFSSAIAKNAWMAFPAVLLAEVGGRAFFLLIAAVFQTVSPLSAAVVWSQIQSGFAGLILYAVLAPLVIMALAVAVKKSGNREDADEI